jgi:hypothetical protein
VNIILAVGNKTDLSDKRQVSTDEGERKVRREGASVWFLVSGVWLVSG